MKKLEKICERMSRYKLLRHHICVYYYGDICFLLAVFEVYESEVTLCFFDSLIIDAFSESKLRFPDVSACS